MCPPVTASWAGTSAELVVEPDPVGNCWSYAAVNKVAERPAISPSKCFSIVATPTGSPVVTSGSGFSSVGTNAFTLNVPLALMGRRYRPGLTMPGSSARAYSGGVGVSWVRYIAWTSSSSWTVGPTTAMPRASIDRQFSV